MSKLHKLTLKLEDFILINDAFTAINKSLFDNAQKLQSIVDNKESGKLFGTTTFEDMANESIRLKAGIERNDALKRKITLEFWEKQGKNTQKDKFGVALAFDNMEMSIINGILRTYKEYHNSNDSTSQKLKNRG